MKKLFGLALIVTILGSCGGGENGANKGEEGLDQTVTPLPDNSATNANTNTVVTDTGTNNASLDTSSQPGSRDSLQ